MKRFQTVALLAGAGALLAVPGIGQAHHKPSHAKGGGNGGGTSRSCAKKPTVNKGFVVRGTLASYNAGGAASGDETVTITVTKMNRHARRAGLTDADTTAGAPGLQYRVTGAGTGGDAFNVQLSEFEPNEQPENGEDIVRIVGKVAVTKKKCARGASLEDRYGAVDVRRAKIVDVD